MNEYTSDRRERHMDREIFVMLLGSFVLIGTAAFLAFPLVSQLHGPLSISLASTAFQLAWILGIVGIYVFTMLRGRPPLAAYLISTGIYIAALFLSLLVPIVADGLSVLLE